MARELGKAAWILPMFGAFELYGPQAVETRPKLCQASRRVAPCGRSRFPISARIARSGLEARDVIRSSWSRCLRQKSSPCSNPDQGEQITQESSLFNRLQDDHLAVGLTDNAHRYWGVFADFLIPLIVVLDHLDDSRIAGRIEADIFSIRCQHSERRGRCCHRAIGIRSAGRRGLCSIFIRLGLFCLGMRSPAARIQESSIPGGRGSCRCCLSLRLLRHQKSREKRAHSQDRD